MKTPRNSNRFTTFAPVPEPRANASRKKGRYHHGALREALLRSVEDILRGPGLHALSLRAAARRARVSHSAPAHHFRNKAGLLTAFAVQGFDRLSQAAGEAVLRKPPKSGADLIEILGEAYVGFAMAHPHHFMVMYRSDLLNLKDPEYRRASSQSFGVLRHAVTRCVQEGLLPRRNYVEAAAALLSLAHGLVMLWFSGRLTEQLPELKKPDMARQVIGFFVRGILVPASASRRPARKRK
jgi:AcrR family transcriptional regulator